MKRMVAAGTAASVRARARARAPVTDSRERERGFVFLEQKASSERAPTPERGEGGGGDRGVLFASFFEPGCCGWNLDAVPPPRRYPASAAIAAGTMRSFQRTELAAVLWERERERYHAGLASIVRRRFRGVVCFVCAILCDDSTSQQCTHAHTHNDT